MRAVIQRVKSANVKVKNIVCGEINNGLVLLLGIEDADTTEDIDWLCAKISQLRIFDDENEIMNLSVKDVKGEILIVSQFTLHASTKKGNRPSYIKAAKPDFANNLYVKFIDTMKSVSMLKVETGIFGAMMCVELINDGPVTIIIDTKNKE